MIDKIYEVACLIGFCFFEDKFIICFETQLVFME